MTENGEYYYVRRDLLKLGVDNSVKHIEREIQAVKDNPIIRLKPAGGLQPESANIKVEARR